MAAIGEGFETHEKGEFRFIYEEVARVWNNGSVVISWLIELTEQAFSKYTRLDGIKGVMHSSEKEMSTWKQCWICQPLHLLWHCLY